MTFSFSTKNRRNARRENGGNNAERGRFVPEDAAELANADSADAAASTSLSLSELFDEDLLLLSDDGPEKHAKREWRQCLRNTDVSRRDDPIAPPTPTTPPLQRRRSPSSFMRRTFFSPPTRRIRRGRRRELGGTDPRRRSSSRSRRRPHFYDAELLGFHPVKNRLPLRIRLRPILASKSRMSRGGRLQFLVFDLCFFPTKTRRNSRRESGGNERVSSDTSSKVTSDSRPPMAKPNDLKKGPFFEMGTVLILSVWPLDTALSVTPSPPFFLVHRRP